MPIAEDSAGGSPVPIPTNLTTNLTGEATGSGTLDYTTGDIDIAVTVVDNGHNHILSNITDVQVNNAISGQILVYNGTVWANATNTAGITAIVQDTSPQLGGNLDLNNRNITGTGNIAITGTIDGRDVSADGTKLDGIESGATADQTAAQIKTAYESNANTNNFADADVSKLSGIEPGATADQTAAQIKTAYESNADTNAFTDADHTKLDGIETAADVTDTTNVVASLTAGTNVTIAADGTISATGGTSGIAHVVDDTTPQLGGNLDLNSNDITGTGNLNFTGSVTLSGTVDGRDVAADGTKLDGIEASADVTDTANVTAAGALMDSEVTNLAQVKAFDSSDYATAAQGTTADAALPKAGGTMTGALTVQADATFTGGGTGSIVINDEDNSLCPTMTFLRNGGGTTTNDFIKFENSGGEVASINSTGGAFLSALDVSGGISINSYAPTLTFNDLSATSDYEIAVDQAKMQIKAGTATKLEVNTTGIAVTGKIGVGDANTVADHELHIQSSSPTIRLEDTDGNKRFDITQSGNDTNFDFESNIIYKKADGTEVARIDTDGIDVSGDILLDSDNAEINLKSGITGTSGAVNWTFNTTTTNYASLNLNYDTRATTGFHIDSGYPITIDSSGIGTRFAYGGTEQMRLTNTGRLGIGHTSPVAKMAILGSSNSTITEANSNLCVEGSGGNGMLFGTLSTTGFKSYIQSGFVSNLGTATYDLLLNPEGGNVGVGLSAPTAKMHLFTDGIDQSMFSAQADLGVQNRILTLKSPVSDSSSQPFRWQTSNSILWEIDGTESKSMNLNSAGNLGLGTYSPTQKLEVTGKIQVTSADPEIFLTDTTTGVDHSIDGNSGVGNLFIHVDKNNEGSDPKLQINVGDGTGLFCIEEGGDTGVGTTNPANRLHIFDDNSNIDMNSSANGQLHIDGSGYGFAIALNTQGANIYTNVGTRDIIFGTNETERMRVTDDGTICTRSGVAEATMISFENGNGQVGKISSSGLGTVYGTTSDYRLKTDAQPMTGSIDRLKALNPINFEWISDGSRVDGFLAHEVQSIVPEAVTGTQDAMKSVVNVVTPAVNATYDEEGNQLTPEIPEVTETTQIPDYQSIDQGKIVPLLTSALQDAIAKIEALETRLEALES